MKKKELAARINVLNGSIREMAEDAAALDREVGVLRQRADKAEKAIGVAHQRISRRAKQESLDAIRGVLADPDALGAEAVKAIVKKELDDYMQNLNRSLHQDVMDVITKAINADSMTQQVKADISANVIAALNHEATEHIEDHLDEHDLIRRVELLEAKVASPFGGYPPEGA